MTVGVWKGPTPQGLAEVVEIAKANVKSAALAKADIVDGRYALTFRELPVGPSPRQKALDEMEGALNAYRLDPTDPTGINLRFE